MLRIGSIMERSEFCLLGAEGVMENGGIINKVCLMNSYALHVYCIKLYTYAFTILFSHTIYTQNKVYSILT